MSSSLFTHPVLKRVPLVRYSARTKRENRIQVQLLKDFPQYGVKGEIIEVLPGLMRNKLYPNNGACYIIPKLNLGPKIEVVKRDTRLQQQQQKLQQERLQQQLQEQKRQNAIDEMLAKKKKEVVAEKIAPVEIEGLLFDLPEGVEASGDIVASQGYSMITLEVGLDTLRFQLEGGAVSKKLIAQKIQDLVGFSVPVKDLEIIQKDQSLETLDTVGEYRLVIKQQGVDTLINKKILVEA
jgi:ribosomal protein L9